MAELGNNRKCYIGTSISGTWTWLSGEQSSSLNRSNTAVETSDKRSTWQQFICGIKGATADVTVFTDDTDAQQMAIIAALAGGTNVFVFIGELSTSGSTTTLSAGDAFEAVVTAVNDTNDNGSVASRSISLTATGPVTHYPAS